MKFFKPLTLWKVTAYLFLIALILFAVAFFAPIKPIKINSIIVGDSNYQSGDQLEYTIDRCRNIGGHLQGTVVRSLINVNEPTQVPILLSYTETGDANRGCGKISRTVPIPYATPPGTYKLELRIKYNVFFFRAPVDITGDSNEFNIEK